jgi:hypothetical protein
MNAMTNLRLPAAAAACLLLLAACEKDVTDPGNAGTGSTTESGVVAGRLLAAGGAPLAGAKVVLLPADHVPSLALRKPAAAGEAITDAQGGYRIEHVDAGTYSLSAARDSLAYYRDSLGVPAAGANAGTATALPVGSLTGRVRLEPGDEVRTVLILALGTNVLAVPKDTGGAFSLAGMAEGEYHVRFLSTLSTYVPLDTILTIRSGRSDTLPAPIRLRSRGIPAVTGLTASWDAEAQAVALAWDPADSARAAGYNVYRAKAGDLMGTAPLNPSPLRTPAYRDTAVESGMSYAYAVKAVDGNGNPGPVLSAPATVATEAGYVQARLFVPEGGTNGRPCMAVSGGEIYWLRFDRVDVYDTLGNRVRAFGNAGAEPLNNGAAIRILGDTVFVADLDTYNVDSATTGIIKPKFPHPKLRKFDRSGNLLGTVDLGAGGGSSFDGAFDFQFGAGGMLYATNGRFVYSLSPGGKADSVASPLDAFSQNVFAKLEAAPDGFVLAGSYGIMDGSGSRKVAQFVKVGSGLELGPVATQPVFLNAFLSDAQGNTWMVRDDSIAEARSPQGTVTRRIRLPKKLYREIQVEDGALYLFDTVDNAIRIWRRR